MTTTSTVDHQGRSAISNTYRRWAGWGVKAVAVVAAISGTAYWVRFSPIQVRQHQVARGALRAEVMGTGTLEARVKASITPKISGRVRMIAVDQGDVVSSGKVLVTLDDEELQQQVEIAQANLETAQAAIDRLKSDEVRAAATLTSAKSEHHRVEQLAAKKVISQSDIDKSAEALAVAEAGVDRAKFAVVEGRKQLVAAEKTTQYHQARLADTQITAPFDGLIVRRQRDAGDVAVPGSPILTLISTKELWISAWVDETEMSRLKVDQPARVVFRSEPDREFWGRVFRLGREADRETREFVVDVHVLELPANWAVGQRADVYIETERKPDATVLPPAFVVWRDNAPGVFINANGAAEWRPLVLGLRRHDMVEVVRGVEPGEFVVMPVDGQSSLRSGGRIHVP
ncbi:MAG: efflux RND transporter periplasmic adaptor subunit [Planctomycetales bacterium]|nr:efflux RND transporter periplasmic adaptor subunit [Planctomycetales bacterium]